MSDEPTSTTDTTAAPATVVETTNQAPEAKTFTQEQVNAIVQQRLATERQSKQKAESPKGPPPDWQAKFDELEQRRVFEKNIARYDANDEAAEILFNSFKTAAPDAASARQWVDDKAKAFGMKPLGMNTTAPIQPTAPIASAPTAPVKVEGQTVGGIPELFNLTGQQLNAMGPEGVRAAFEQILAIGNRMNGAPPIPRNGARK